MAVPHPDLPATVIRLMAARVARSVGQGALVAAFALYLHALDWSAPASLQNVSIQIPRALGPLVAGFMLHAGMLRAPFFVAALLQGSYLVLYVRFFGEHAAGESP